MKRRFLYAGLSMCLLPLWGANLLTNASFEETVPLKKSKWRTELVKDWTLKLNSGAEKCEITLQSPGHSGKQALLLRTIGKAGFNSAVYSKDFDVTSGQQVTASVMMRGKGQGYIRIYFIDAAGKRMKNYQMSGKNATDKWVPLITRFTVPDGVAKISFALETLRNDSTVQFDDAKLEISAGDVLKNANLTVKFNSRLGGSIDSLIWEKGKFDFTAPNLISKGGGLLTSIIPENFAPGEISNRPFKRVSAGKDRIAFVTTVNSGKLNGLEMTRSYRLLPDGVEQEITLVNKGKKKLEISHRIRNVVSSEPGVYSWPTPDWVTAFHQSGKPLNGLNTVIHDLYRAGWEAKYYEKIKAALVFNFDTADVRQMYTYFNMTPKHSTIEWYFRPLSLAPGESKKYVTTVKIVPGEAQYYADAKGKTQKCEFIQPVKMPEVPARTPLPKQFDGFFPYQAPVGNLNLPEMAGFDRDMGYSVQYAKISLRLMRIMTDAYINAFAPGRFIYGDMHKPFFTPDGKHKAGEFVRRNGQKIFLSTIFSLREDIDVDKYMKEKWPKYQQIMGNPDLQKFIQNYKDVIPLIYTGDELLPQNADVMLRVHQELRNYLPEHVIAFPYLNSTATDLMPYLPIFIGDWYPVKRSSSSGRNPWNVYQEFSQRVKQAGDTPVWFMPQGFAGAPGAVNSFYALPTAGEIRLMLHLAAAAGVKGIAWHGFPSGTWPWMMNYYMYDYSLLGGAGQRSPSWQGVIDAGRTFATVGPLLTKGKVAKLPAGYAVKCGNYTSPNKFYTGTAIRLFALKLPEGMVLLAVNQNPEKNEKGEITLPAGKIFDLNSLKEVKDKKVTLSLAPGDGIYWYCGDDFVMLDDAFRSRFAAERARYLLLADRAAGDGIAVANPDSFAKLPPKQALEALLEERKVLEERIAKAPLGKVLADMEKVRSMLDRTDFRLCRAKALTITPEMRQKTPKYQRWTAHSDRNFNRIRERMAKAFARYCRLLDAIDNGEGSRSAAKELPDLLKETAEAVAEVNSWLDNHPEREKMDNPYAY